ncbi:MAG: DEAD/DEAH box helicase family protein [Candidatus Levybacteria bacterium]|nr:DEAD/DEAH box helicase family protein [Candidatus Levybacteria bacterium]
MQYFFKQHEANFKEWRKAYDGIPDAGVAFLKHLNSSQFKPDIELWNEKQWKKIQVEAIERCVYSFEVLGLKDVLTNIVTGGGKTTIIGAMIAYMMIVHDQRKFLILTPNTIVRSRLTDEFDPNSPIYIYNVFPFFFNSYLPLKDRISLHIMKAGESSSGVRSGNILIGNIHQIYERTDNWKVIMENVDSLVILNDEAHNTKAEQYNDLISKLKPKRFFRLDTTATPDRLDGLHPDSEMIFVYSIAEAMRDKVIKRIVVFHPDVRKVQLTYEDLETGKTISAEEVPWEEIERRKIPARRYITSLKPMRQQIAIALELLKRQRMAVPRGKDGNPRFKPLLFVIALSIKDAENISRELEKIGPQYDVNKFLLVHNEQDEELVEQAKTLNQNPHPDYDAVISVLMLREGWDVRNIAVEVLFRKFSYKEIDGQKFSVYGPQVIGRGLRRMGKSNEEWESLFVVDHPILKHDWLWENLKATEYPDQLDPANIVIDEQKIPTPEETIEKVEEGETTLQEAEEKIDLSKLPPTPEPPEVVEPIYEWQKHLDEVKYDFHKMNISEDIAQIKSLNLDSEHVTLDKNPLPELDVKDLAKVTSTENWNVDELKKQLTKQIHSIAQAALLEFDRNPEMIDKLI